MDRKVFVTKVGKGLRLTIPRSQAERLRIKEDTWIVVEILSAGNDMLEAIRNLDWTN